MQMRLIQMFDVQVIGVIFPAEEILAFINGDAIDLNITRLTGGQRTHQMAEVLLAGMAVDAGGFGKVFFETAGKGLLVIKLIFYGNIKNALARETQSESGQIQTSCANIRRQRQTGLLLEKPLQIPFRVA
ncbi:hypothetical protein D3C79_871670 [compost metagenome]